IDVSTYQNDIDWDKVAASGVEFAIIRCGYRGSTIGGLIEDSKFKQNIEGATRAGVKVGVYFFTQAINEIEAVEEASMVVMLCRDYHLDYPVFIDVEGAGGNGRADGLDKKTRTEVVKAFCKTIESEGLYAGVYSGRWWYYNKLNDEDLQDFVHWLAEYRSDPLYTGRFSIWQYTSDGHIDGIDTRVDLDLIWQN
ncbi:MAG: glycoside hydrolase family 25 protein, partial [Lachnospiraceae bacterium]|nr:glycoside hydrolase family 25 protein [Lachnospiraceae bacterium]